MKPLFIKLHYYPTNVPHYVNIANICWIEGGSTFADIPDVEFTTIHYLRPHQADEDNSAVRETPDEIMKLIQAAQGDEG